MQMMRNIWRLLTRAIWHLEAAIMLAVARFLIGFIPFRYWRKWLGAIENTKQETARIAGWADAESKAIWVGRCVSSAAKKVPFEAVCLPQAMAGRWMLKRRGISSQLFIGAKRNPNTSGEEFHAWLTHGDICLTKQHGKEEFQAFGKSADKNMQL